LIQWACERAGLDIDALAGRFPSLPAWQRGEVHPTLKQLENLAKATHTPFGYFFLPQPPVERVPIPDFRTARSEIIERPSPNLLDTIYICQQRQEWYREFARITGERPFPLVGSAKRADDVATTAAKMRDALAFDLEERRQMPTWIDALRRFIGQADNLGVLVMVNGVVGSNNRRKLDPAEFRGFALADPFAPLVFINGADTKAAQMFTLAHELAHLWLGESALSDVEPRSAPTHLVENWCNRVAAELLAPLAVLRQEYRPNASLRKELDRLARRFKVSTLVVLRRIHDVGGLSRRQFWSEYESELARLRNIRRTSGGDFYLTTAARVGKRFARAVVTSTWEGRSSFTEAFRLLGFKKMATFHKLGQSLGVSA
jgi:Zn-dependent peptidase ImmA (M78 family)